MLLPTIDFETYSDAGFEYDLQSGKWIKIGPKGGIQDVGSWAYSRHPSTEVLWLSFDMRDGQGVQSWFPWLPAPTVLFDHIRSGGVVEAHNSFFEYGIWNNVFTRQLGAPPANISQFEDSAAACSAWGLPRSLDGAASVLGVAQQKDTKAAARVKKLWMPRKATKNNPRLRLTLEHDTELHMENGTYCEQDVRAEMDVSQAVPPLSTYEHKVWQLDQRINARGVHIDRPALNDAIDIIAQMRAKYVPMQRVLTGGAVKSPNSYAALRAWVCEQGVEIPDTQAETVNEVLERDDTPDVVRKVLDIQVLAGGAAIKKIYAMDRFADQDDDRIRGVFVYYGAVATGRWASRGCQMHNFANSGPDNWECSGCGEHYGAELPQCPFCRSDAIPCRKCSQPVSRATSPCACGKPCEPDEWGAEPAESAIRLMKHRSLDHMETVWGNAQGVITSCTRGIISAAPGHDLICSDYSAIEARVLACLAGEQWRIDVFKSHGRIYEASAAQMFGLTMEDFSTYRKENGSHHPARKKGKVAELAGGYQGGPGAFKAFGADKFMTEQEIKDAVKQFREASPNIVALWYGLEEAAVNAIKNPGQCFRYKYIAYQLNPADGVLYCQLPSGRLITYHGAWITTVYVRWEESGRMILNSETGLLEPERVRCEYPYSVDGARPADKVNHMGTPRKGGGGMWVRCTAYGGVFAENVCQAVSRDILADAMLRLDAAGYSIIMHVHDEIIAEVPHGFGSVEEFERIMGEPPSWCSDWPLKAADGWRGLRYRK